MLSFVFFLLAAMTSQFLPVRYSFFKFKQFMVCLPMMEKKLILGVLLEELISFLKKLFFLYWSHKHTTIH